MHLYISYIYSIRYIHGPGPSSRLYLDSGLCSGLGSLWGVWGSAYRTWGAVGGSRPIQPMACLQPGPMGRAHVYI